MEDYVMNDILTGEKLTQDNLCRCLDGYLESVNLVDKSVAETLLEYVKSSLLVGGIDLCKDVLDNIMVDLYFRYY